MTISTLGLSAERAAALLDARELSCEELAAAYLELSRKSVEAFENAKMRGRFLEDLEEENARLQKELTAREDEIDELQLQLLPEKKGWLK